MADGNDHNCDKPYDGLFLPWHVACGIFCPTLPSQTDLCEPAVAETGGNSEPVLTQQDF